jgi:hypothetical protein
MATSATQAQGAVNVLSTSSAAAQMGLDSERLSQSLANWDTEGQERVQEILSTQTAQDESITSTIPLSNTLIDLLQSDQTGSSVQEFLVSLVDGWEDERKEILWEALVDATTVLVEGQEDVAELNKAEGMEVDEQTESVQSAGEKGVQIVKSLLVSRSLRCISFFRLRS